MDKPKKDGSGFSAAKPDANRKGESLKNSSAQESKEQQALKLISEGKFQEAAVAYREHFAAGGTAKNAKALYNLGKQLKARKNYKDAISIYRLALKTGEGDPRVLNSLGIALRLNGEFTEAAKTFRNALKQEPARADYLNNLGNALCDAREFAGATSAYKSAICADPALAQAHCGLGTTYFLQGEIEKAINSHQKALELKPNFAECLNNLGLAFHEAGEIKDARSSYIKALKLNPGYHDALKNLSMTELLAGNYATGWKNYEFRLACGDKALHALPGCPKWTGAEISRDKQLLLVSEQGLGDSLQFMRYAITLRKKGISVSVCAPLKLHKLIQTAGIDPSPLTPQQANAVKEGFWIPLLSVPRYLEVSPDKPIITEPYIKTTDELICKWQGILSNEKRPIIGLNWQGNPDQEKTNSIGRSLPLETFATITQRTNSSLLSLQKGFGSEQLDTCSFNDRFVSCQDKVNETWDFLETAAIIANCDLVITSDTSVAHLAGGMGKTTWLLLKKVPDWRWGLEGDTTFWYPSLRLFRQRERGNWDEVLERVAEALQEQFPGISAAEGGSTQPRQVATKQTAPSAPKPLPQIKAPISLGELIDKITILEIKSKHLQGSALEHVEQELAALQTTLRALDLEVDASLIQRLKEVNADLWQIEDDIRGKERNKEFGEAFIGLARSVYQQNDRRAVIKKEINTTYGSALVEEKAYREY